MQVFGWPRSLLRAGGYGAVELSPEGRARLRALSLWRESGNAKLVCSTFGVSRATLYRWRKRFAPRDLPTLQERTRRPRRVRQPTWSPELVKAVLQLREQYPPVGKGQAGGPASTRGVGDLGLDGGPHPGRSQAPATAGRAEGQGGEREAASGAAALRHAQAQGLCARPSRRPGPGGHPRAFPPCRGEVEAIHRPGHGLALGRDGGLLVRHGPLRPAVFGHPSGARSVPAAGDSGGRGLGVPGGVRGACAEREILLFELPPRSPKLNGRVERANRTHTEEFYEVYELPWTVASLNVRLREWEQVYNHIRPHWALDYLTPAQVLETFKKTAPVSHMS